MSFKAQTSVRGTYHGQPYSGVVVEARWHTVHPTRVEHTVALDQPIVVFGDERTRVLVATGDRNEENSIEEVS